VHIGVDFEPVCRAAAPSGPPCRHSSASANHPRRSGYQSEGRKGYIELRGERVPSPNARSDHQQKVLQACRSLNPVSRIIDVHARMFLSALPRASMLICVMSVDPPPSAQILRALRRGIIGERYLELIACGWDRYRFGGVTRQFGVDVHGHARVPAPAHTHQSPR